MTMSPELTALRDEAMLVSCESWAIQHRWVLNPGIDRSGPCPVCGGRDRFSIHTKTNLFNCRRCGMSGSGVIDLVMKTQNVGFVEACEIVTGRRADAPVDEARMAELRRRADREAAQRAADADAYREKARRDAYAIWKSRVLFSSADADLVRDYHRIRAIDLTALGADFDRVIGFHPEMPWTEAFKDERGNDGYRTLHVGPAQLAAIVQPDGHFAGVHITWIDLAAPKGRLKLPDLELPDGKSKPRPTKKVRGVKKGGAIRLFTPVAPRRIVMGEGIESTGTPLCHAFERDTAYWAGCDVGNMGGKALYVDRRPIHDQPDMDDLDCFLPPDWCEQLVYLGEGDEPEVRSEQKCIRGLRRAKTLRSAQPELPPLDTIYVPAEPGSDMNELAMADMAGTEAAAD